MDDTLHAALREWEDFYLIAGGAASALTGLQFVVQTLIASEARRFIGNTDPEGTTAAFGSPTVVHFTVVLLLSALLSAPWPNAAALRTTLVLFGVGALAYSVVVLQRTRRQSAYRPVLEDWVWHIILPIVSYAALLAAALSFGRGEVVPLFVVAGATLVLLCVGIHNSWDTVTYLTAHRLRTTAAAESEG